MSTDHETRCRSCGHPDAGHRRFILDLRQDLEMTICSSPACPCGLATTKHGRPAPADEEADRAAAPAVITAAGLPLPRFLQ